MRYINYVFIVLLMAVLSGCSTCKPMYPASGDSLTIKGVSIPLKTTAPIKIGQFVWEPVQIQQVSSAIQSLDAYAVSQCRVMETLAKTAPQSPKVGELADKIAAANEKILGISSLLAGGQPPATVAAAAKEAVATVETGKSPDKPGTPSADLGPIHQRLRSMEESLVAIDERIGALKPEHRSAYSYSASVGEFAPGRIVLTADLKSQINKLVSDAGQRSAQKSALIFDCVGFADAAGNYLDNLQLALARARSVAAYLATVDTGMPQRLRSIASGGISLDKAMARRVEIQVTLTPL